MPGNDIWCILLIDDDEDDFILVNHMLSRSQARKFELDWASNYLQGHQALREKTYDAVLIDYDLGAHNGLDLLRQAAQDDFPAPFILLTGRGSYEIDLEAMRAGVTIYLTKSEVNPMLLERSIRYAIELKQNQRSLVQQNLLLQNEIEERQRVVATLSGILNAAKESIWLFDPEGNILLANDTAIARTRKTQAEILGKNFRNLMDAELASSRFAKLRQVVETGEPLIFEDERAGIPFHHSFYPVKDVNGNVTGIVSFSRDITRQKQAEAELQAAHKQTFDILESIADAFYSLDKNYCFTYVNRKAGLLWGIDPAGLIGRNIWDIFPQFKNTDSFTKIEKALREGIQDQYETYSTFLDQWVEVHLYPNENGLSVYFQDITERKHMEEHLRKLEDS